MVSNTCDSSEDAVETGYDLEASGYDEARFSSPGGRLSSDLDDALVVELLQPAPGKVYLDMPAGTARSSVVLAEAGAKVYAVDVSAKMLAEGRSKVGSREDLDIALLEADGRELPFDAETFDGACCLRLFHLIRNCDRRPFFEEFWRVLKPEGLLVVEFPRRLHAGGLVWLQAKLRGIRRWHFLRENERDALFEGFEVVECRGGYLPFMRRLAQRDPADALRLSLVMSRSWQKRFSRQAFFLLRKW